MCTVSALDLWYTKGKNNTGRPNSQEVPRVKPYSGMQKFGHPQWITVTVKKDPQKAYSYTTT